MLQEKGEVSKSDAYEVKLSVEEFEKLKGYIRGCYKYRIAHYVILIVTLLFALSMVALPICTTMGNTVVYVITGAAYIIALGLIICYIVKKLSYTSKMTYENMSERMWLYKTKCINREVWVETHGTGEDRQTTVHIDYNLFVVLGSMIGYFIVYLCLSGFIDIIWSYSLFGNPFKISAEVQG